MPNPKMETPVFDKFMREISNENGKAPDQDWIAYMLRFCGYCLIGEYQEHVWSMWVGSGRNGKGALERVIESILGEFAVHLRWSEIAEQKMGAENTLKRTAFKLMGARVAFVEESGEETGRRKIETSSVKYFTGGDVLVGAAMRQNEVHRKPSHKLVRQDRARGGAPASRAAVPTVGWIAGVKTNAAAGVIGGEPQT